MLSSRRTSSAASCLRARSFEGTQRHDHQPDDQLTNITYNNSLIVDRGPSYDELRARSHRPIERLRLERTQDFNDESPVSRGQVVALLTADFHPAERAARPNRVARNIAQPEVERGWS